MSRAARLWSLVAALAVAGALVGASPAAGSTRIVLVEDSEFAPSVIKPDTDDPVNFALWDDAGRHSITSDTGLFDLEFTPDTPHNGPDGPRVLTLRLDTVGTYHYHCKYHGKAGVNGQVGTGMAGTIMVKVPWKSTTTTTQSAGTATSSTTTTPAPKATTAGGAAPSATQAGTSAVSPRSTPTSRPTTTTAGPPVGSSAARPSTTTAPTATAPVSVASAAPAPPPTIMANGESTPAITEADALTSEASADASLGETAVDDGRAADQNSKTILLVLGGVAAVLAVGGGGWAWYHRSSRYLPA